MTNRKDMQKRQYETKFTAKRNALDNDSEEMIIEGYFAVFNRETELWKGAFESIKSGAFANTLSNDIRALVNHDTTLVLGRNKSNTLELREDSYGLWGRIVINPNDTDAVNLYERVRRGDVDQCSFGFDIVKENTQFRDNGDIKWEIEEVRLYEVSACTFPAYEETGIQARKAEFTEKMIERKKLILKERLKNVKTSTVGGKT